MFWIYYYCKFQFNLKSKRDNFTHEIIEFKYFILLANIFQIIFNDSPQFLFSSIQFVKNFNLANFSYQNLLYHVILSRLNFLISLKIVLSIFRISWISMLFVKYFVENEFKVKFERKNSAFVLCRFVANFLLILFRYVPLILLYGQLNNYYFYVFLLMKFAFHFGLELTFFFFKLPESASSFVNLLTLFWCLITSLLRMFTYVDEFQKPRLTLISSSEATRKINYYFIVYICFNFGEYVMLIFMMLCYLEIKFAIITIMLLSGIFASSLFIEYIYWNFLSDTNPLFRKNFKNWILLQNEKNKNTESTIPDIYNDEKEHFIQ
jgi:hypothetical protein